MIWLNVPIYFCQNIFPLKTGSTKLSQEQGGTKSHVPGLMVIMLPIKKLQNVFPGGIVIK